LPTWLAWFGRDYAPHVADSVKTVAEQRTDGAWLLRAGPEPMDVEELAGRFPTLPARLIYEPHYGAPAGKPIVVPAEFIPGLEDKQ